ncbi:hypothetical protein HBB16_13495 [Pseudonocardia sp. MCCB 268]|nr:hypothetical protein [Pseudonocardia cytotoxica]
MIREVREGDSGLTVRVDGSPASTRTPVRDVTVLVYRFSPPSPAPRVRGRRRALPSGSRWRRPSMHATGVRRPGHRRLVRRSAGLTGARRSRRRPDRVTPHDGP